MIDGVTSPPFSATTLPPIGHRTGSAPKILEFSRAHYSQPREEIEKEVFSWAGFDADINVDDALAAAKKGKKDAKKKKFAHSYDCTRCKKTFELPVELDRSRPIYCEDCHGIMRDEKAAGGAPSAGGGSKAAAPARGWSSKAAAASASTNPIKEVPTIKNSEPVIVETKGEISLHELEAPKPIIHTPAAPVAPVVPKSIPAPAPEDEDDILKDLSPKAEGPRPQAGDVLKTPHIPTPITPKPYIPKPFVSPAPASSAAPIVTPAVVPIAVPVASPSVIPVPSPISVPVSISVRIPTLTTQTEEEKKRKRKRRNRGKSGTGAAPAPQAAQPGAPRPYIPKPPSSNS